MISMLRTLNSKNTQHAIDRQHKQRDGNPKKELKRNARGTPGWLSQLSIWLDFSSGHDLIVCEIEPHTGLCADSTEPAWDSLCLSPFLPLPCPLSHYQNKHLKKEIPEMKVSVTKMKNALMSSLVDLTWLKKEPLSELEDMSKETSKTEKQREKKRVKKKVTWNPRTVIQL